ncbi:hypothetical protein Taro_007518 [Colocasia esculenta]|uniref:Intracellular protein transport protein USO1-like protein n=1 Tax=Colocasia esculenta TaxID=4460 RepID=A0A843U0N2_COLES|nr:hypothetical protein [Colocasia esculenta]
MVTKLKLELENAHAHIEELLHEKQSNHHEIDSLTKQLEDKLARKSKEQEKTKAAVKSLEAELEDEKSLRRHSEILHRRLGKELSEVKAAFSKIMREFEGEKRSHNLLEDLCDEFAKGITEYEDEVRELKWKYEKGSKHRCNSLILDFSEAWLDERLQIKLLDSRGDLSEKKKMVDKLECDVEAFLRARRSCSLSDDLLRQKDVVKERCLRRQSLESIHLNGAGSAPQYAEDEDSVASDLHCFELKMGNATERGESLKHDGILEKLEEARNSNVTKKVVGSSEKLKYHGSSSSWTKFGENTQSCNDVKMQFTNKVQGIHRRNTSERRRDANLNIDVLSHQKSEEGEGQEDAQGMKDKLESTRLVDHVTDDAEFGKLHKQQPEPNQNTEDLSNDSCELPRPSLGLERDATSGYHHAASSPLQKWSYHHVSPDLQVSESSKLPQGTKESTLKARLLEARLEGQHARLKTSRDSSVGA